MSRQHLFHGHAVEEEDPTNWRYSTPRHHIGSPLFNARSLSDLNTMTLERKMQKNSDKDSNPYGTLPRPTGKSTYAKLKTIGVFTKLYLTNKEAHIADEELKYLKAVESGDLDQVREILRANKDSEDSDDEEEEDGDENDSGEDAAPETSDEVFGNHTISAIRNPSFVHPKENGSRKGKPDPEAPVVVEMVELEEKAPAPSRGSVMTKLSSPGLWQKASTAASTPLPVSLVAPATPRRKIRNEEDSSDSQDRMKVKFNKDCRDQWGRSALFIAMIHHNLDMLTLLLQYKVGKEECLYHAIDFGYYDVVELFMQYDNDTNQMITGEDSFYPPGLTPIQLAAHKNDYVMLKILYSHGYRIQKEENKKRVFSKKNQHGDSRKSKSVLEKAWDSSNHEILYYRAKASPAYMVMMFNEGLQGGTGNWDFLENIFTLYGQLKKKVSMEPTVRSLYLPLAEQVEEFACNLLSEVRSSQDLANLLRFDPPGFARMTTQRNHLTPVQRAIEVRMKRFVAHENSQLAITSLRLGTLFESEHGWRTLLTRMLLAFIFPILCLAFVVAPDSKLGKLLRNPIVNMSCHITSEVAFVIMMFLRLVLLTQSKCDCLGMAVQPLDYLVLMWVLARIVNQIKKLREMSIWDVMLNVWTLNDFATSCLFIIVIGLKIYELATNLPVTSCEFLLSNTTNLSADATKLMQQCTRDDWTEAQSWPITLSETALAIIYLLIHVRAMELLYTDRTFGPLQLSLDKMLLDTIRFLTIFSVTFLAFGFAMTQLYWSYGSPQYYRYKQQNMTLQICDQDTVGNCSPVYSDIIASLLEQYWTLYGYGWGREPPMATKIPHEDAQHGFTEVAGQFVSMLFHAWAVVVMLNMLVAMMSHSFERVRNNAELVWKFHRSGMWMKFIRKGVYPRPPPMNLIPSTRDIKSFWNFLKRKRSKLCQQNSPSRSNAKREVNKETSTRENLKYRQAITNITQRYLRRYLLPDFRHDEIDQPVNRSAMARRASTVGGDESS